MSCGAGEVVVVAADLGFFLFLDTSFHSHRYPLSAFLLSSLPSTSQSATNTSFAHRTRTCLYNYTHIDGIIRLILYLTNQHPLTLATLSQNPKPYSYHAHPNQHLPPPLASQKPHQQKTPNRVFCPEGNKWRG